MIFLMLMVVVSTASAQKFKGVAILGDNANQDTLTNAATKNYAFGEDLKRGGYMGFGLNVTKASGTVAGIVYYQGSADGTNYVTVSTDTLTDATNDYEYNHANWPYRYARISVVGSGTSVRYLLPQMSYIPK